VGSWIAVYIDDVQYLLYYDNTITSGQPGIDVAYSPSTNGISAVDIGHIDVTAPGTPTLTTTLFSNKIDFQWPPVSDDPSGTGVYKYELQGSNSWYQETRGNSLSDTTVSPSTAYSYRLIAVDYHLNAAQTIVLRTTASTPDPRQMGVRSLGSYWGGGGEQ